MSNNSRNNRNLSSFHQWRDATISLVIILGLSVALVFWKGQNTNAADWGAPAPLAVKATEVTVRDMPIGIAALGELEAVQQVMVAAEAGGRVTEINFEAGQQVPEGELLLRLNDDVEQQALIGARATAQFAEQQLNRARDLVDSGAVTQEEFQQRQSEYDSAIAQIGQLEARIRQLNIRAPFAGILGIRRVDVGQYLNPGDALVSLTDSSRLFVNFNVPQRMLARIQTGQEITVSTDSENMPSARATISAIEPQVGSTTRNATVQGVMDNAENSLNPGMYVEVNVALSPQRNAIVVPVTAVMTSPMGNSVVVVRDIDENRVGTAEVVSVETDRYIGNEIVLAAGITPGDLIVTEGQLRIQPGSQVRIVEENLASSTGVNE